MTDPRPQLGRVGENLAEKFLRRSGFRILQRNYRCPGGEIDLIAREADAIVFVEVKTRLDTREADPENNIGPRKQARLIRAARFWLQEHRHPEAAYRFDSIAVVPGPDGDATIHHIREAFLPPG